MGGEACDKAVRDRKRLEAAVRSGTINCETVRWAAATFSRESLEAMARRHGVTAEQRAAAARCLSGNP